MLDRNRRIKPKPERFQCSKDKFDILITCEERVYDQVIECMEGRTPVDNQPVHLINIDIQDNHEEATVGSFLICELVTTVRSTDFFFQILFIVVRVDKSSVVFSFFLTRRLFFQLANSDDLDNDIDSLLYEFESTKFGRMMLHTVLFY